MRKHAIKFTQPTLTQQHSKDEVDINNIMARYIKTGVIDHVAKYSPQYTENTSTDYHQAMNIVLKADTMFGELPSTVRKQFDNNPAEFLTFVNDEKNHDKLAEMGLTNKSTMSPTGDNPPPQPPVQPTQVTPTPTEPAPASTTPTAT